ncbi:dynein intermediate chain 3, ciliary [Calliphora vicina]|uniref:dynein intermediate chain 3, ciliary n=1 Tax=Calliphora vicina TaxID=7373 RepID=UPI00325BCC15
MHMTNQFIYSRERRRFGRQCMFSDRNQKMLSIHPSQRLRLHYILRNPVNTSTQLSDQKASSVMETENVAFGEHGMYHYEGGWPKEVNLNDEESTLRHRKKIEREDNWGSQVTNLIYQSGDVVEINNTVNIYQEFFNDLPAELCEEIKELFEARQKNIFHDPVVALPRPITVIDWAPSDTKRFLVLHTNIPLQREQAGEEKRRSITKDKKESIIGLIRLKDCSFNNFYIWDLENPLKPMVVFKCDEMVLKTFFCPKDDNWLAGGLWSGKVCIWDARSGNMPVNICPLEAAHREAVPAVCWVHSKTNTEFYTGSYDGSVKFWDGRDLDTPLQEILLDPIMTDEQSRDRAQGVTVLEFEYTIPVRFIAGSDMGSIFVGNRKGMTPMETWAAGNYRIFSGPIRTIERNPFFVKNFLITGDWCAKVWSEECKGSPTTLLIKKKSQILCGTWSTMRCSLFVTGDMRGELDFWDLLLHQRRPIFSVRFSSPIIYAKFRSDGDYLAVCLANGDVQLLELDAALKHSTSKDKALIAAMFEREQLRCKLLEGRVEEMKLKRRTTAELERKTLSETQPRPVEEPLDPDNAEEFLRIISADLEFREGLNNFQDHVIKVEKKRQERQYVMERTEFEIEQQLMNYNLEDIEPENNENKDITNL